MGCWGALWPSLWRPPAPPLVRVGWIAVLCAGGWGGAAWGAAVQPPPRLVLSAPPQPARQPGRQAGLGLCWLRALLCARSAMSQRCFVLVLGARRTGDIVGRDRVAADGRGLRDGREDLGDSQQEAGHRGLRCAQLASEKCNGEEGVEKVVKNGCN